MTPGHVAELRVVRGLHPGDKGLELDGPEPHEHLPVGLPGGMGERRRHEEEPDIPVRQDLRQRGESYVVADDDRRLPPRRCEIPQGVAGHDGVRLHHLRPAGRRAVEEVDLVVTVDDRARGIDHESPVEEALLPGRPGHGSCDDEHAPVPGKVLEPPEGRLAVRRSLADRHRFVRGGEHLGQAGYLRPHLSGAAEQCAGPVDVRLDVVALADLAHAEGKPVFHALLR